MLMHADDAACFYSNVKGIGVCSLRNDAECPFWEDLYHLLYDKHL